MKIMLNERRLLMSSSRFRICACTETSSADTGSSSTSTVGSSISARAMATRWHWPPDISCGRRDQTVSASKPTSFRASVTRWRFCSAPPLPQISSGSATTSAMRRRGLSEEIGSWNTICSFRRNSRREAADWSDSSSPEIFTVPEVGGGSCISARASVDFPQPDSPTRPSVSSWASVKLTSSTGVTTR